MPQTLVKQSISVHMRLNYYVPSVPKAPAVVAELMTRSMEMSHIGAHPEEGKKPANSHESDLGEIIVYPQIWGNTLDSQAFRTGSPSTSSEHGPMSFHQL